MAFSTDPEWLEQNFNKYESLIDTKAAEKAYEDYKTQREYLSTEEYYRTFSGYAENKDLADSLWPSVRDHDVKYYDHRYDENGKLYAYATAVYKNGVKLGPDATRSWFDKLHNWADAYRAHYRVFYNDILPQKKIDLEKASNTYTTASNKAFRAFDMAMIRAWSQRDVNDDPYSLEDLFPNADLSNMSEAEKKRLLKLMQKLGVDYGEVAALPALALPIIAAPAFKAALAGGMIALTAYLQQKGVGPQLINQIATTMGAGSYRPASDEQEKEGIRTNDPRYKQLTPDQQAEVEAAGKELSDAQRALNDLPADATDAQRDAAQERVDRASKNRQRLRKKHREENKHRKESYKPKFVRNRQPLTERKNPNQKRILREIRKPVSIKEAPTKYKINFSNQNTASSQTDELVMRANARGQQWKSDNKRWSGYETTEKDNIMQDRIGHGKQAFDYMIEQGTQKSEWRTREVQEELNKIAHEKAMLKENPDFKSPFGEVEVTTTESNMMITLIR